MGHRIHKAKAAIAAVFADDAAVLKQSEAEVRIAGIAQEVDLRRAHVLRPSMYQGLKEEAAIR